MVALTSFHWAMVGLLVACYLVICVRMATRMAHTGRNFWKWLAVTFFFTGIPAVIVLRRHGASLRRSAGPGQAGGAEPLEPPLRRCPRCRRFLPPAEMDEADGITKCPHCGLPVEDGDVA